LIDWAKVAQSYAGIEFHISRLQGLQSKILEPWTVDGGCLWDEAGIQNIKPVLAEENANEVRQPRYSPQTQSPYEAPSQGGLPYGSESGVLV
jgi:hypothetical protein